jgi:hypothetical protein
MKWFVIKGGRGSGRAMTIYSRGVVRGITTTINVFVDDMIIEEKSCVVKDRRASSRRTTTR